MLVISHTGAGVYSVANAKYYLQVIKDSCESANNYNNNYTKLSAALKILEESPITNAGIAGSNLDISGNISVDSAVMDGNGSFGSIGAVPAIVSCPGGYHTLKHPHSVALHILHQEAIGPGSLGRIPPMTLAGVDAFNYAMNHSLTTFSDKNPTSDNSIKRYQKHQSWLQNSVAASLNIEPDLIQDTVGVIVCDGNGNVMSSVSSSGMSLKEAGRIGEAAVFGAGVWASNIDQSNHIPAFAISVSGQGEQILRTQIARSAFNLFSKNPKDIPSTMRLLLMEFVNSPLLKKYDTRDVGFMLYYQEHSEIPGEIWIAHTTDAFAFVCF